MSKSDLPYMDTSHMMFCDNYVQCPHCGGLIDEDEAMANETEYKTDEAGRQSEYIITCPDCGKLFRQP